MPFSIVRQDITRITTDAIVAAEGHNLASHGWVGRAIAEAAGPEYQKACEKLEFCNTGDAKITFGYNLAAKYVIHTTDPDYQNGRMGEPLLLKSCYEKSLALARDHGCKSIAFPVIATGGYGFPKDEALKIASDTIREFLEDNEMDIYLVTFDRETTLLSREMSDKIEEYIDDNYLGARGLLLEEGTQYINRKSSRTRDTRDRKKAPGLALRNYVLPADGKSVQPLTVEAAFAASVHTATAPTSLEKALQIRDESFQEMLLRLIAEKQLKNSEVYTRANISKSHFSKIKGNADYKPKKETVFALAIALELDLEATMELMMKAGYAISHSFVLDTIVEYFIVNKKYNIMDINCALFDHDQTLLGEKAI